MLKILISLALCLAVSSGVSAGTIDQSLGKPMAESQPGQKISAILFMADMLDNETVNQDLKARRATMSERHREVIEGLREKATSTQGPVLDLLSRLEAEGQVEKVRNFWISNTITFRGTAEAIRLLAERSDVGRIYFDFPVELIEPIRGGEAPPLIAGHTNGLDVMHVPEVWAMGYTGAGRLVSNLDTGVDGYHPALQTRYRGNNGHPADECWYDPVWNSNYPNDNWGHGTHTMGTICGRSATTFDTVGVAMNAQWIASNVIDNGSTSDIIAAFQWIADPDGNPGTLDDVPDACGNSWGYSPFFHGVPHCDPTFWSVIDGCENAGVVVVFSAGNEGDYGPNSLRTPADRASTYFNAFSVGAIDGHTPGYPIAYFSSLGPCSCASGDMAIKPELVAPGVNVYSSVPGGGYEGDWSGTSMASPHITGSVAILRQINPNLDVDSVKSILMQACINLGPSGEDNTYGHGYVDLRTAVQIALAGSGMVEGYVRNANNSDPLPARVEVVGLSIAANANSSGYYIIGVPGDSTYSFRASYFGFTPQTQSIYVINNDTVQLNFNLSPAPTAILQGYVRNLGDTAIAGAIVTITNGPVAPDTTDNNGFYRFPAVPVGHNAVVSAMAIGYSAGLDSITIQSGTNNLDFALGRTESFEFNNGGYSGSGVWEWGIPAEGPPGAHSGIKCWGTILAGMYPDNVDDILYSVQIPVSSSDSRLEFWHWYDTEATWDGGNVSVSTDNGATWTLIYPDGGYPDPSVYALDDQPGYSGANGAWALASFPLTGYGGRTVKFRWRFSSDGSIVDYGWYIDDVSITTPEPPNISFDPSFYNVSIDPGNTTTRPLNIHNTGAGPLNYSLVPETFTLRLVDGRMIPVRMTPVPPESRQALAEIPAGSPKPEAKAEPLYPPMILGQGGPDTFGHRWIDSDEPGGPTVNWIDISGIGTPVTLTDDSNVGPVSIGFSFPFFENNYSQLYICSNGMLTFGSGSNVYQNTGIPGSGAPNNFLPIFWDDLDPGSGGTVRYYFDSGAQRFIVSFDHVLLYRSGGSTGDLNFQAVIYPSGVIEYNYATMNPGLGVLTSATVGIENAAGGDGLQIVYSAAYIHNNLSIRISKGWLLVSPSGGTIDPGNSAVATITFDATSLDQGTYNGNLNLDSNDPDQPNIDIPVTLNVGSGGTPDIVQTPASINDTLYQGQNANHILKVKNMGTGPLTVSFNETASWITMSPGPFDIQPGDSLLETVGLNATGLNPSVYNANISTTSNDPDTPTISTPVTLTVLLSGAPDIDVTPTSFADTVQEGNTIVRNLYIGNVGTALLHYGVHDNRAWITVTPDTGNVPVSQTDTVQVTFSALSLTPGTYTGQLNVNSDDGDESLITLPVTLLVSGGGGGCVYIPGDINDSGTLNGIDVTYGVGYLKGGAPPPYSCECTPGNTWYVAGDFNATCSLNGIDITYAVTYFKGGPEPQPCPDCPPLPILMPAGTEIDNGERISGE